MGRARILFAAAGCVLAAQASATTLKVGVPAWPPGFGNPYGSIAQPTSHTRSTIYDALVKIDDAGKLAPVLALKWEALPGNIWRFHLRPNVVFSNGEPFNAAAVKAAIDWLRRPDVTGNLLTAEVANVAEVRVIDEMTVDIVTKTTDAVLPKRLTIVMMVPPKAWAETSAEGFMQKPIGTGPYVLKDWGQTSGYTVIEASPTTWRKPKQIDRVELHLLREPIRRTQALSAGQVDLTQAIGPDDIAGLEAQGIKVMVEQEATVMGLFLPNQRNEGKPLHDVRVRQALNYAVNKDEIATVMLRGTTKPAGQGAIPGTFGYNPDLKPYPYDPAKAKALLKEAGYPNGFKMTARLQPAGPIDVNAVYQKVAADLQAVGVQMELRPVLAPDWVRFYSTGIWDGADALSGNWNASAFGDTIRALEMYACKRSGTFFCDQPTDALINASNVELDEGKREKLLQDAMARFHDLAPSLFLVNYNQIVAYNKKLRNVALSRAGYIFEEMEIAE